MYKPHLIHVVSQISSPPPQKKKKKKKIQYSFGIVQSEWLQKDFYFIYLFFFGIEDKKEFVKSN